MASYIKAVQSGARIAGKLERDMVQRHLDDLERKENDESFGYVFSDVLADRACDFFSHLRHTDGEYSATFTSSSVAMRAVSAFRRCSSSTLRASARSRALISAISRFCFSSASAC